MAIFDTVLLGFFALLLTFKVLLLASATMLLLFGITKRLRRYHGRPRQSTPGTHRLDTHA